MHPSDSPDSSAETALAPETDAIARPTNRSVLLFTPDDSLPPSLESHLESESGLEVSNATSTGAVLQRLEATDCLVLVADETENAGETTTASVDVLDRLRNYAPAFPVVVVTTDPDSETATELATAAHTQRWTVHVPISAHDESADLERIGQRVTDLVDHHRLDGIVSRSLAAVELTEEPLAIVAPDGTFEHVTRRYTMQFGYSPSELEGQPGRRVSATKPFPTSSRRRLRPSPMAGAGPATVPAARNPGSQCQSTSASAASRTAVSSLSQPSATATRSSQRRPTPALSRANYCWNCCYETNSAGSRRNTVPNPARLTSTMITRVTHGSHCWRRVLTCTVRCSLTCLMPSLERYVKTIGSEYAPGGAVERVLISRI